MDVTVAIGTRRALRSLEPIEASEELIRDLAHHAQLAPSCNNFQPWRFVFVSEAKVLLGLQETLTPRNAWAKSASLMIAVFARRESDCIIRDREYYQFDCGLASAFLMLRATELGLVAHPIAGFDADKAGIALAVPDGHKVITLIIVGRGAKNLNPALSEHHLEHEKVRPARLPLEKFVYRDRVS
jgi:nitroreductase